MADIYINGQAYRTNIPSRLLDKVVSRAKQKVYAWRKSPMYRGRDLTLEIIRY